MVSLVAEHHHILHTHEIGHDPLEHLAFALKGLELGPATLKERTPPFREIHGLAELEGVIVGDNDLRPIQGTEEITWHELIALVVAVWIVWIEHPEPILDRQSGCDD